MPALKTVGKIMPDNSDHFNNIRRWYECKWNRDVFSI